MNQTKRDERLANVNDATEAGEALMAQLQALVTDLNERASAAEAAGRIPDATVAALQRAGAFRAVVPERFGGLELPFPYVPQIFRILARGCVSTAWSMGFLVYHNFQFAHFGEDAQQEVWGEGSPGYTMAPGQVMPAGTATPVEGGWRLNGYWGYATGIHHGDWMLISAPVTEGPEKGALRRFYAPVSDFEVLDTWNVAAMKATGSDDVKLTDVFVPAHRSIHVADMREMRGPGLTHNPGPLWRVPLLSFMTLGCVGVFIGAAERMLEEVTAIMKVKVGAYSGAAQQGLMTQRVRLARLAVEIDAVVAVWERMIAAIWEEAKAGRAPSREMRAEARYVVSFVAARATEIVDELARSVGSRSFFLDNPIQRFHRDISCMSTHALFEHDHTADMMGGVMLGEAPGERAMI